MKNSWSKFLVTGLAMFSYPFYLLGIFSGFLSQAIIDGWLAEQRFRKRLITKVGSEIENEE